MSEEYNQDEDKENWQVKRPGEKTGDAAGNDGTTEPKKYKNFWKKFAKEIQEKSGKSKE